MIKLLGALLLSALFATAAHASQTVVATPSIVQWPLNAKLQLTNGSTSGTVLDCTSSSSGTGNNCNGAGAIITSIMVTSTDTSAQTLTCNIVNSAVTYVLFVISIPANSGNVNGTPPVAIFNFATMPGLVLDSNSNYTMPINNVDKITCAAGAVTTAKNINIYVMGGAF